jgi:hypothetical protein
MARRAPLAAATLKALAGAAARERDEHIADALSSQIKQSRKSGT